MLCSLSKDYFCVAFLYLAIHQKNLSPSIKVLIFSFISLMESPLRLRNDAISYPILLDKKKSQNIQRNTQQRGRITL